MKYLRSKLGEIAFASNGPATPFEIKTTSPIKWLLLRVSGKIDVTADGTAVPAYGSADLLKAIAIKINGSDGPVSSVNGRDLLFKNLKDWARLPKLTVPAAATIGADKAFEVDIYLDMSFPHMFGVDAKGNPVGPDLTIWSPKEKNNNLIQINWGTESDIITGGTKAFDGTYPPKIEVFALEAPGLPPAPNKYHGSYTLVHTIAAAISAEKIPIPFGTLLNELQIQQFDAAGVPSESIVTNVILRNGTNEVFCDMPWAVLKQQTEDRGPILVPSTLPTGMAIVDLSPENSYNDLLPTAGMKDLRLELNCSAAGSVRVLVNELRDGID